MVENAIPWQVLPPEQSVLSVKGVSNPGIPVPSPAPELQTGALLSVKRFAFSAGRNDSSLLEIEITCTLLSPEQSLWLSGLSSNYCVS